MKTCTTTVTAGQSVVQTENVYSKRDGVGGWGGECTCPDGSTYEVGDNKDSCGSLACIGGKVTKECSDGGIKKESRGMSVTCGVTAGTTGHIGTNLNFEQDTITSSIDKRPSGWNGLGTTTLVKNGDKAWDSVTSKNGDVFVSLKGPNAHIEQRMYGFVPGEVYKLTFLLAHKAHKTFLKAETLSVLVDGHVVMKTYVTKTFTSFTAEFEPRSESSAIRFAISAPTAESFVYVDGIEVEQVPAFTASLMNGDFEDNAAQGATGAAWTAKNVAYYRNGQKDMAFMNSEHGKYVAAIQALGSLAQNMKGLTPGQLYEVTFVASTEAKSNDATDFNVVAADNTVWSTVHLANKFAQYSVQFIADAESMSLTFKNDVKAGTNAAVYIDAVSVNIPEPSLGVNMNFEADEVTDETGVQNMLPAGWTSDTKNRIIIVTNANEKVAAKTSSGNGEYFVALSQSNTAISQSIDELSPAQMYELSFLAARSKWNSQVDAALKIFVDEVMVWQSSDMGAAFHRFRTTFMANASSVATIKFVNDSPSGDVDKRVFIDDVQVTATGAVSHCSICPDGFFSNATNAASCIACTDTCGVGFQKVGQCSPTTTPTCVKNGLTTTAPTTPSTASGTKRLTFAIDTRQDSAEEFRDGRMYQSSGTLEMCADERDGYGEQTVGIFFPNVAIPPGATVRSAYVMFEVDDLVTGVGGSDQPLTVQVSGEANPSAMPSLQKFDLTSRCKTSKNIMWRPEPSKAVHETVRTANFQPIVQEIVTGTSWTSGSRLGLFFSRARASGSGNRVFESVGFRGGVKTPSLVVVIDSDADAKSLTVPSCSNTPTPWSPTTTTSPKTTRRPVVPTTSPPAATTNPSTDGWCVPGEGRDNGDNSYPCEQFGQNDLFCEAVPGCVWVRTTTTARAANINLYSTTTSRTTTTVNAVTATPGSSVTPQKAKHKGAVIGAVVIILAIAVIAGFYKHKMNGFGSAYERAATGMENGFDVQGALRDAKKGVGNDGDDDSDDDMIDTGTVSTNERGGEDVDDPRLAMNTTYVDMPGDEESFSI